MGLKPLVSWRSRLGPGEVDLFAHHPSAHHSLELKPNALIYSSMFFLLQIGSCLEFAGITETNHNENHQNNILCI